MILLGLADDSAQRRRAMSRTATRRQWRQEKRQKELPLPEPQPMSATVDLDEGECCGGYCGESGGEEITAILLKACPTLEDIADVFYGHVGGVVESWVDAHVQECANCQEVMKGVIRMNLEMRKAPIDPLTYF